MKLRRSLLWILIENLLGSETGTDIDMGKILLSTNTSAAPVEPATISGRRLLPTNPAGGRMQSRLRDPSIGRPTTTVADTPTTPTAGTLTAAATANMDIIGTCGTPKHRHQEFTTTLNSLQLSQNHVCSRISG